MPITSLYKTSFKSSNKKIVTVDSKGMITAKKAGTATITIKSGKKSFKVKVTVKKVKPTAIIGLKEMYTVKCKRSITLKPKLYPLGAEAALKFTTSNKKIATVNAKGKVTGRKAGTAIITVKAGMVKVQCKVVVKK